MKKNKTDGLRIIFHPFEDTTSSPSSVRFADAFKKISLDSCSPSWCCGGNRKNKKSTIDGFKKRKKLKGGINMDRLYLYIYIYLYVAKGFGFKIQQIKKSIQSEVPKNGMVLKTYQQASIKYTSTRCQFYYGWYFGCRISLPIIVQLDVPGRKDVMPTERSIKGVKIIHLSHC